jgi:hypothetical protein
MPDIVRIVANIPKAISAINGIVFRLSEIEVFV